MADDSPATTPYSNITDGSNGSYGEVSSTAVFSSEESASHFCWECVVLTILWGTGLILLVTLITLGRKNNRRNDQNAADSTDVEGQLTKNNNHMTKQTTPKALIFIPIIAAMAGLAMSIVPHTSCKYVNLYENYSAVREPISIGIWSAAFPLDRAANFGGEGNCYYQRRHSAVLELLDYHGDTTALKVARAFAVMATILGGIGMLVLVFVSFRSTSSSSPENDNTMMKRSMTFLTTSFGIATLFQFMTIAIFWTDYCTTTGGEGWEVGMGGMINFTACYYWFLAGLGVRYHKSN